MPRADRTWPSWPPRPPPPAPSFVDPAPRSCSPGWPCRGRDGFYRGAFGDGLLELGGGLFVESDLAANQADWVTPLTASAFGVDLHTIGPNSQGYLTLGAALLAEQLDLPDDPDDERWAHLLVEAATAAGFDRPDRLHEGADGAALLASIAGRVDMIGLERSSGRTAPVSDGDTTYLCTAGIGPDGTRMGVSLIQSNASGFGSHLVEPNTGINLHNRGLGFNLDRRPPRRVRPRPATTAHAVAGSRHPGRSPRRCVRHDGWRRPAADPAADR